MKTIDELFLEEEARAEAEADRPAAIAALEAAMVAARAHVASLPDVPDVEEDEGDWLDEVSE